MLDSSEEQINPYYKNDMKISKVLYREAETCVWFDLLLKYFLTKCLSICHEQKLV